VPPLAPRQEVEVQERLDGTVVAVVRDQVRVLAPVVVPDPPASADPTPSAAVTADSPLTAQLAAWERRYHRACPKPSHEICPPPALRPAWVARTFSQNT
jgi:hypothetical protein